MLGAIITIVIIPAMAMSTSVRLLLVALGLCGAVWGAAASLSSRSDVFVQRVARNIIAGEPVRADFLKRITADLEAVERKAVCHPFGTQGAAIIRLRLFEEAFSAGEREEIEQKFGLVRRAIHASLACAPADPYIWVVLFWLETTQTGFQPLHLKYLDMSYRLGPNEGWIGLTRVRLALANWPRLSAQLAETVTAEFSALVANGAYSFAAALLRGPGWPARDALLSGLRDQPEHKRKQFQNAIYRAGLGLKVPGITQDDRPVWMQR